MAYRRRKLSKGRLAASIATRSPAFTFPMPKPRKVGSHRNDSKTCVRTSRSTSRAALSRSPLPPLLLLELLGLKLPALRVQTVPWESAKRISCPMCEPITRPSEGSKTTSMAVPWKITPTDSVSSREPSSVRTSRLIKTAPLSGSIISRTTRPEASLYSPLQGKTNDQRTSATVLRATAARFRSLCASQVRCKPSSMSWPIQPAQTNKCIQM